jgi:hypothetical protein
MYLIIGLYQISKVGLTKQVFSEGRWKLELRLTEYHAVHYVDDFTSTFKFQFSSCSHNANSKTNDGLHKRSHI